MPYLTIRRRIIATEAAGAPAASIEASPAGADSPDAPPGYVDARVELPEPSDATGATLAQAVYLSGLVAPPALCSGLGRCGRCRVRFLPGPGLSAEAPPILPAEREVLSQHDLEAGWRLACRHAPAEGMRLLLPPPSPYAGQRGGTESADRPDGKKAALSKPLTLAVDLGTTSLHWQGSPVSAEGAPSTGDTAGVMINPQMGAGSDVMSRLAYAASPEGAARLQKLTLDALVRICEESGFVTELCLAANPAMTAIALGKDISGLTRAPYHLDYMGGKREELPGLPPLWVPSQISPFIGGDISAGYAALMFNPKREAPRFPFLLADLGTNGECLLALSPTRTLGASVPMGPALEGINLSFGTEARPGAVMAYSVSPLGLEPQILGDTAPRGITAAGYLSLLQALRKAGLLTPEGLFAGKDSRSVPLRSIGAPDRNAAGEARLRLPGRMFLSASDVEEILKVKAAFSLALSRLLAGAGLVPSQLTALYLAGALGTHIPAEALEDLGFIPSGFAAKIRAPGNTSLAGARLFLDRPQSREQSMAWAESVTTLELAGDAGFTTAYAGHMVFAWR